MFPQCFYMLTDSGFQKEMSYKGRIHNHSLLHLLHFHRFTTGGPDVVCVTE